MSTRIGSGPEIANEITGSASGSTFVTTGGSDLGRQVLDGLRDLLADVLRRVVDVALEDELEHDPRVALADGRVHFVDAGDAAERLLRRLGDRRYSARPGSRPAG